MHSKLVRTPGIYIVGFMGSGKSTVGEALADELGWAFVDLDSDIETAEKTTISDLFAGRGEPEFRRIELCALEARVRKIQCGEPAVVSLGGGAFTQPACLDMVRENGISIWLDCSLELIRSRIAGQTHRPLARDPVRFEQLYKERLTAYARADYRVEIHGDDPGIAVSAIMKLPIF